MKFFDLLLLAICHASPARISTMTKDLGAAERIYVSAGLASVVEFPRPIVEVRVGDPSSLKVQISTVSPRELTIYLSGGGASPTNLIVRADRRIYVFDVVPSRANHQDYVRVRGAAGSPETTGFSAKAIAGSRIEPKTSAPTRATKSVSLGGRR